MDEETFEKGCIYAQPLTSSDRKNLRTLLTEATLADCVPLLHDLLKADLKLGQEAVEARGIIDKITMPH